MTSGVGIAKSIPVGGKEGILPLVSREYVIAIGQIDRWSAACEIRDATTTSSTTTVTIHVVDRSRGGNAQFLDFPFFIGFLSVKPFRLRVSPPPSCPGQATKRGNAKRDKAALWRPKMPFRYWLFDDKCATYVAHSIHARGGGSGVCVKKREKSEIRRHLVCT